MDLKVVENAPAGSAMTDEGPIVINSTGSQLFELQNHINYEHNIPPTPLLNMRTSQYFELRSAGRVQSHHLRNDSGNQQDFFHSRF